GGEPRRVCEHPLGVEGFAWSPDSTRIAYVARVPQEGRYGTDKDVPPEKEPPRRITTFQYRLDNLGFTFDRRPQVFVVDALAEGATIWFLAADQDLAGRPTVLWSVPADGSGKPERLTDPERFDHDPAFGAGILPLLVDAEAVTTISLERGAVRLLRFPVEGG